MDRMGVDGIEFPSKDQYRIVLELYQSIWDGGLTASKQKSIKAQSEIEKQNMEVSLYAVYQQINQLYFGILLLEEQLKQNELFMKELNRNYQRIEKFIDNGLANSSDLNKIKVEILMREQTKSEMTYNRKAYVLMLSLLIGQNINEETRLEKPKSSIDIKEEINRPELKRYDAQLKLNDIQQKATLAKGMPRIGLFAQGAYANPGLNMFKSGFSPYFMGGISLSWNFSGLYTYGDENKNLNINANSIAIQKETFLFNLNQQVSKTNSDIEKAKELMQRR